MTWLAVFLGGGVGSLMRYAVGVAAKGPLGPDWPWGTLIANVLGSLLLGLLAHLGLQDRVSEEVRLALTTGLCGGFTTYSTFNVELLSLMSAGQWARGGAYLLMTLLGCAAAGLAGIWIAGRLAG